MKCRDRCELEAVEPYKVPEPDYVVKKRVYLNGHTVVKVWYRKATNCGGEKVLVMPGKVFDESLLADPHFREECGPIARFHPSQFGWDCAMNFLEGLDESKYL